MPVKQGSIDLLQYPASKELLQSTIPARLASVGTDGTPRVVPIWFHWNEREFVLKALFHVSHSETNYRFFRR